MFSQISKSTESRVSWIASCQMYLVLDLAQGG